MNTHALIQTADTSKLRERDFGGETPPTLAPEKGLKWVPVVLVGEKDPVDTDAQIKEFSETVTATQVTKTWTVRPMTVDEATTRRAVRVEAALVGSEDPSQLAVILEEITLALDGAGIAVPDANTWAQDRAARRAAV